MSHYRKIRKIYIYIYYIYIFFFHIVKYSRFFDITPAGRIMARFTTDLVIINFIN